MRSRLDRSPGEHVVHFYRDDAELAAAVVAPIAQALANGEPTIVIAVPAHREAFATGLVAEGIDLASAEQDGRLVWRDAEEFAARLLAGNGVDAVVFATTIGALVRGKAAAGRVVHAYGEIVAVLWSAGHVLAAMELERLWNDLITDVPMSLLCGYPAELVAAIGDADADYLGVCAEHGRVVGSAPIAADAEASCRFPGTPASARHARRFVAKTLAAWGCAELVELSALVVSELASNAVRHARSDFTIALARTLRGVRVAVGDTAIASPRPRRAAHDEAHGRGLQIVATLSSRWGSDLLPDGKLVWAELVAPAEQA